jgi:very-short-patch-repair endonuclease
MNLPRDKNLTKISQKLRKVMTKEERHLWYDFLRTYPVQFKRQKVIGSYVVDFFCDKPKLVIELDGSQHFEDEQIKNEIVRDDYLSSLGLKVLHVSNDEIWDNFEGVCAGIDDLVKRRGGS